MPAHVDVELDIFSGMPNPTWALTNAEADDFAKKLAALSRTSATELAGNLGYRGFVVQIDQGAEAKSLRVQTGIVQISAGATRVYAIDKDRALERWLLVTGKPHLKADIAQIVERSFP